MKVAGREKRSRDAKNPAIAAKKGRKPVQRALPAAPAGNPLTRAQDVGVQLQSAFGAILQGFPDYVVKVAAVARWLNLDRSICQRVVMGVRDAKDGLGVLERFPGVRGLEQFVAAAQRKNASANVLDQARDALEAYAALVSQVGGSQSRLVDEIGARRTEANGDGDGATSTVPLDGRKWRRKIFEGSVGLTGLQSAARVEVLIIRPHDDGKLATSVGVTGLVGVRAARYAMPIVRKIKHPGMLNQPASESWDAVNPNSGLTPNILLSEFSTQPPPRVTTRGEGEQFLQVFNLEDFSSKPVDLMASFGFARRTPDPNDPDATFYTVGRGIGLPTRRLLFDIYLHQNFPPVKSVSTHVLRPSIHGAIDNARPASRWFDRIPGENDLLLLSGAPGDRPSSSYPRIGELTRHLIDSMRWTGESFRGYRLEVEYPIFDFEYVLSFELAPGAR